MSEASLDALNEKFGHLSIQVDELNEHVVRLELDRPDERNSLNEQLRAELSEALVAARDDNETRVIVLTGAAAGGAFCAGADLFEIEGRDSLTHREKTRRPRAYDLIYEMDTPVIAAVNGYALGGGCELALACDMRIARTDATLGQLEINLGLIPGGGATQRLPKLIGAGQARKMIFTGEMVDADRAVRIGLVDEVHEGNAFDERVAELATSITEKSPIAIQFASRALRASDRMELDPGIDYENELASKLFDTDDFAEGVAAFKEGRDPEWSGR